VVLLLYDLHAYAHQDERGRGVVLCVVERRLDARDAANVLHCAIMFCSRETRGRELLEEYSTRSVQASAGFGKVMPSWIYYSM
jgi:hypothetical protein